MAVHLLDPLTYERPEPEPGCDVCGALSRQLAEVDDPTSASYDPSKATDIRVEMRRHQKRRQA